MGDLEEVLQLIADGSITPQVETSKLAEFPRVLESLVRGEVRARVALTHDEPLLKELHDAFDWA